LLAACGETTAPQRLSDLWPEPPPNRDADLATAGWQGYWYARYLGGLIATQPGLGLPANTLDARNRAAFTAAGPQSIPIALPYATATVDVPATPGGLPQVRHTDDVIRVRTAALYVRLLQALARAHRLRAPQAPPGEARSHELWLASAYTAGAVEGADRVHAELFRPRLGVRFDSDDTYDPIGNIDLIWATADATLLARTVGSDEAGRRLQVAADELGVPIESVEVVHGDTGRINFGMGTYGSRSACVGGSALVRSAEKVRAKVLKLGAHLLEAAEEDVVYDREAGRVHVKGSPDRGKDFGELAFAAYTAHNMPEGMEPGLNFVSFYDPANFTFPASSHICEVDVCPDTWEVRILRYVAVDDVGKVINPMIVEGQIQGGVVQGVGQALTEIGSYSDDGQLLSGTLLEYAVPRADLLPGIEVDRIETPSPHNPLGVKGAGEMGTIAATPAVANAVLDALAPLGVSHIELPLTPERIWRAVQAAGNGA